MSALVHSAWTWGETWTDVGPHLCRDHRHNSWFFLSKAFWGQRSQLAFAELVLSYFNREKKGGIWVSSMYKITGAKNLFFVPHICDHWDEVGQTDQLRPNKGLPLHAHFESNLPLDCNLSLNFEVFLLEQKKIMWMKEKLHLNQPAEMDRVNVTYADGCW